MLVEDDANSANRSVHHKIPGLYQLVKVGSEEQNLSLFRSFLLRRRSTTGALKSLIHLQAKKMQAYVSKPKASFQ